MSLNLTTVLQPQESSTVPHTRLVVNSGKNQKGTYSENLMEVVRKIHPFKPVSEQKDAGTIARSLLGESSQQQQRTPAGLRKSSLMKMLKF